MVFFHDDVIKWKHFPRYWSFVRGIHRSGPGEFPSQRPVSGALMFPLICAWINGWINNRKAGDLRRHRTLYDVSVMCKSFKKNSFILLKVSSLRISGARMLTFLDYITVAISEADEMQSDVLIQHQHVKYLYYLLCRKYAYYCFILGSNCSLLGCRHSFVNMAVYLHTDQWSVNPLSQVVRPLTSGEISTRYKSRWYDNDHYNPLSLECSLLIGQQLRPTHDSYDHTKAAVTTYWCFRKMTVTTNSSESKHADCGKTEQRHLNYCNGSWSLPTSLYQDVIVPVGIAASWWYPRLFGLAVFGRRHLGWW